MFKTHVQTRTTLHFFLCVFFVKVVYVVFDFFPFDLGMLRGLL